MSTRNGGGRKAGVPNYKKEIFLNVVSDVLPSGANEWQIVAERYQMASGEIIVREGADVKRYFIENCCNNNKKPTGRSSPPPEVARAQTIHARILNKSFAGSYGENDEDFCSSDSEEENGKSYKDDSMIFESDEEQMETTRELIDTIRTTPENTNGSASTESRKLKFTCSSSDSNKSYNIINAWLSLLYHLSILKHFRL